MKPDAIFRIASMTKPLVSVAAMMRSKKANSDDLASVGLFAGVQGGQGRGVEKLNHGKPELVLEPAQREMTIQDLLRHTSGLTYGNWANRR